MKKTNNKKLKQTHQRVSILGCVLGAGVSAREAVGKPGYLGFWIRVCRGITILSGSKGWPFVTKDNKENNKTT